MSDTPRVIIQSPVAKVWEGDVKALSAENSEGVFDILPDHARFMSLLNATPLTLDLDEDQTKSFTFKDALLYVDADVATIYVQEPLQEITS
jgi:F0F1-type ATP synthase epsilon subunit